MCSLWEQFFPFEVDPFQKGAETMLKELPTLKVYPIHLNYYVFSFDFQGNFWCNDDFEY